MAAATTYPRPIIARLLMLSERRVSKLTEEGVIPKLDRGEYELAPAVQGYITYLRKRHDADDPTASDVGKAKQRLLLARASAAEAEAQLVAGLALKRAEVDAAWAQIIDTARTRLLALPQAASPLVHAAASVSEVNAILTAQVHDALDELAGRPVYQADRDLPPPPMVAEDEAA